MIANILVYKFQQDAHVTEFIYQTTALHVSGVTLTHLQEHKTTVTTASGKHYTVCCCRGRVGTNLSVLWVEYTTHYTLK
jgi:hypothetical protein